MMQCVIFIDFCILTHLGILIIKPTGLLVHDVCFVNTLLKILGFMFTVGINRLFSFFSYFTNRFISTSQK